MSTENRAFDDAPRCDLCNELILEEVDEVERNGKHYHDYCWEAENGPSDDPDAWSGGFAENH